MSSTEEQDPVSQQVENWFELVIKQAYQAGAEHFQRGVYEPETYAKLVAALVTQVVAKPKDPCNCRFCVEVRARPAREGRHAICERLHRVAKLARCTIGTPITECTNSIWCLAVDLASEVIPRRDNESEESFRHRLGRCVVEGKLPRP